MGLSFCCRFPPDFPLTFCQNFVEKFPRPSPSPGVHHVWNLSRPPQALPPKKFWAPPDPPRGRYEGSNFQLPPLPPQFPFVKGRSFSGYALESIPPTIPEILVNLRATQPEIFSLSNWPYERQITKKNLKNWSKGPCLGPPSGEIAYASTPILHGPVRVTSGIDISSLFVQHAQVYVAIWNAKL